jgi:hypothetical protein
VPVALSIAPLQMSSPAAFAVQRPRWSQCAVCSTYSPGRSLPGSTPITFLDSKVRMALSNPVEAVTPSGTGRNPCRPAAAASCARSRPAAAAIASATGFCTHPLTSVWPAPPSARRA